MDRGDDDVGTFQGGRERARVADVRADDVDPRQSAGVAVGVACDDPNRFTLVEDALDDEATQAAGPAEDDDHDRPAAYIRVVSSLESPPCSTGSR